ncbi:MAG TPA: zinc ribbon domain-containing protein [Desulfotomaculum sp.]|nr:zinc ribbon domain-containing protein [Desulfotomaculum sp.]
MADVFRRIGEKAKDLGEKAKDLGEKAKDVTKEATKRPSELLEVTRLKIDLSKLEKEKENNLHGIGTLVYQKYQGKENLDQEIERLCQQTKALEEEKAKIEEKINSFKPRILICPDCKWELPAGGTYCSFCGKEAKETGEAKEAEEVKEV